ncbi:DoxX family membrane protein [Candidatus Halobonum tyrrellensis]|uniref:DoxX family protein n=1 Tax=Candidatus Halobonum tyrrellensis G22 TaxID=1324957 RepID=V4IZJ7_9EURY|nr:DoxX family membrane protein [Candidatus Halobonum tyrrellensis]ESP88562.1 hypothetical protein K933_08882 [Candidatus Halobonum tyrrellensis G22]
MSRSIRGTERALAARLPPAATLARWALAALLLLAGVHKLVDPGAWTDYVVDWLEPFVVSPLWFILANAAFELAIGAALLADRYTPEAALVTAVSLFGTSGYLAVVWVTAGRFGPSMVRDFGLGGLALAVFAAAVADGSHDERAEGK